MGNWSIPNKEELNKYYSKGYSIKEISEILGFSVGKIHKFLHIYNINVREKTNKFGIIKMTKSKIGKTHKSKPLSEKHKKIISEARCLKGIGHKKTNKNGYVSIYFPDHPKSRSDGYIMEHDLIMECFIGRWLKEDEVVHHKNHITNDNRIENLQLLTKKEHARLHAIERHKKRKERSDDLSIA
jgi:predicted DNA-binding protein YlxM (UPF0122 family)